MLLNLSRIGSLCALYLYIGLSFADTDSLNSDVKQGDKSANQMVVVVSKTSAVDALNNKNIANIFLTRTNRYPNGSKAVPIELSGGLLRNDFYQEISGKTPMELTAYWTTLIFSGRGRPPKGYADINSLIDRLETSPTAISYLSLAQVTDNMKVVYQFP